MMVESPKGNSESDGDSVVDEDQQANPIGFYPLLMLSLVLGVAFPWGIWLMIKEPGKTPLQQAEKSLELLEAGHTKTAYFRAMKMLKRHLNDPGVGGSQEFIVGVAHFRKAEKDAKESQIWNRNGSSTNQKFDLARRYLEQANLKSLKTELRPEWSYSLGACYYYLGRLYDAREKLELAYLQSEERKPQTMLMLGECYLDTNVMKASLIHHTDLLEEKKKRSDIITRLEGIVDPALKDQPLAQNEIAQTLLFVSELYRQNKSFDKAEVTLRRLGLYLEEKDFSEEVRVSFSDRQQILQARVFLDRGNSEKARQTLFRLIEKKSGLEQDVILQSRYLIGLTYAYDQRYDLALDFLEKPALATDSEVSFTANLEAADLARKQGLHEDALVYYLRALSLVESTEAFTNRWIDLGKARAIVQAAWDEWGVSKRYEHYRFSVELASHMVPLFTPEFANQLSALASRKRAEIVEEEMKRLGKQDDPEVKLLVREHWKRAGNAYSRLASSSQSSEKYGETLWEAGQLYRNGRDFKNALLMIRKYIATKPRVGLPRALILRARTLMDLDLYTEENRTAEAATILENLIKQYPKDQSIYDAQLLLGQAYLEEGYPEKSILIWRALIMESPLTPRATEWQSALFALGRALFNTSDTRPPILINKLAETKAESAEKSLEHYQLVDDAIYWLDEFVRRNPKHARSQEARWLLAKGLRYRAGRPAKLLTKAETENTQAELLGEMRSLLNRSMQQFKILEEELTSGEQKNQLDELSTQFIRDAYFEPAHNQYDLGSYDKTGDAYRKAIDYYSNAAFHFSGDTSVLIAYFRIAECYRQLGAEAEARRQLEQARVILNQLEEPFLESSTNFTKQQWEQLLSQYVKLYDLALDVNTN